MKKADKVKNLATENFEKAMLVNQDLHELDEKAQNFEKLAMDFHKNTKAIKDEKKWENWKWTFYIVIGLAMVVGYFFI